MPAESSKWWRRGVSNGLAQLGDKATSMDPASRLLAGGSGGQ